MMQIKDDMCIVEKFFNDHKSIYHNTGYMIIVKDYNDGECTVVYDSGSNGLYDLTQEILIMMKGCHTSAILGIYDLSSATVEEGTTPLTQYINELIDYCWFSDKLNNKGQFGV